MRKTSKRIFSVAISLMLVFLMAITSSAATISSVVAGVGTDADRTVQVTVQYANPEEAQESTLLVVKKGVSIVTATADQVRYIDQKTVDGSSVTYTFKMAVGDRVGDYDLYVGGTKVDAPASTAISFSTDATTTIKFVKEDGTEIASQVLVSSNLGDIIDLTSYAPETITVGKSIYKKDATNPANFTVSAVTNELTITYTYLGEEAKQFTINGIVYDAVTDNLIYNGDMSETTNDGTYTYVPGWQGGYVNAQHNDLSDRPYLKEGAGYGGTDNAHFIITPATADELAYVTTPATSTMDYGADYPWKSDVSENYMAFVLTSWMRDARDAASYLKAENGKQYYMSFEIKSTSVASWQNNVIGFTAVSENGDAYANKIPGSNGDITTLTSVLTGGIGRGRYTTTANEWVTLETLATATADGYFMFQSGWAHEWGQISVRNFQIYEVEPSNVNKDVTVTYTVNGETVHTLTKTYNSSSDSWAVFDEYYYSTNGSNEMYKAAAANLSANTTIAMTKVANNGAYAIGDSLEFNSIQYNIASGNLIPNGDFSHGTSGWFSGTGEVANFFTSNGDGTMTTTGGGGGQGTAGALYRAWSITPGKTYYFTYTSTGGGQYHKNSVGETFGAVGSDGTRVIHEGVANTDNAIVFTAGEKENYLIISYRWLGTTEKFGDFGLYELELPQTVVDVTATYTAGGKTVRTETKSYDTAIADGATFDAYTYYANGENYIYEAAAQTLSKSATIEMTPWVNNGPYALGDVFIRDDVAYKIVSDNLVPNGDFSHGVTGWYNSAGGEAGSAFVPNAANGTVTNANNAGAGDANSLWRGWATEVGKTYLFTFDSSAKTEYFSVSEKDNLSATADGTVIGSATVVGTNTIMYTATKPYVQINFRWIQGKTMGNFSLYEIEEDTASMANTTIKFVDSSNTSIEIANAVTVTGIIGSAIDLTDTSIVPETFTFNGNLYSKDSTNPASYTVVGNTDTVTLTYTTDAVTSVDSVSATVIDGNAPILPTTLNAKTGTGSNTTVTVTAWDTSNLKIGTNTIYGTLDGLTMKAEATVTVLENTFAIDDITTVNGQDAGKAEQKLFPVAISDEFAIEFTANYASFGDLWITIKTKDAGFFGPEQIPLGVNASGSFRPVNGNGNGGRAADDFDHVTLKTGTNYRFFITTDASTDKYSVTVTNEATGEVVDAFENYGYRTNADAIEAITSITNNGAGSVTLTNIKVSAPSADVATYTVNAVANGTTLETFTGVASDTGKLGYNNEVIYPNVKIPAYDGYVFKNKTVSGSTITLNYEAVEEASFFDNVANDTKFVSLNMLGAHDAFTAKIASNRKDAAGVTQEKNGSVGGSIGALTGAAVDKSIAQNQDVLTMLNYGVRYFDIRLSRSDVDASYLLMTAPHTNGVIYTTHGYLGEEFRPIAYTIAQWAKAHPGEIVVLDFQEYWDNTNGGDGNSRTDSWTDLNNLLKEAGIYDYVTINNGTDISAVTYGSLTNNGEKAGIVLFGRATATNANIGNFILRGTTSTAFDGKMYSNYSFGGASVSKSSLANDYIQAQVDHAYTKAGTVNSMYRVMQAISDSNNLINQADNDNTFITNAVQSNPTWLTTLPVIMVNDATVNTSDLLAILKSCNEPIDVQMNYTTGGSVVDTNTTKLMVGTLYTGSIVGALVSGLNGEYAVTTALGETPVPYNGSITLEVEKLGNVYSTRIENNVHSVYSGDLDDAAVYSGKTNFAAYTWGQDNDRLGVAVLSAEKGKSNYALSANVVRKDFNQTYRNVKFYVLPVSEYRALNLQDKNALLAKLNADTLVADINPDNYGAGMRTIVLDADKIAQAAESGDVVIIGNAQGGLYGIEGKTMAIVSGYNVTVNGGEATIAYGTYTLPSEAIAYHKVNTTEVYKPGAVVQITADTNFTGYTVLGANMVDGAQVRIGDGVDENGKVSTGSGLRFITTIDRNETLASLAGEIAMEMGVEVTAEESTAAPVVIKAEQWQVKDEVFTSAITNLAEGNYNRKFTATPYVKIGDNVFYGTPVTRSIYQVAAGLLAKGYEDGEYGQENDKTDTNYDEMPQILVDVLNAYVNQTGVRLTLSDNNETATLTARMEGKGAYTGEAFFTVGETTYADGKYTVTLTAVGQSKIDTKLFNEYVRINNNNKLVSPVTTITDNGNGTYTIVFDYSNM